MFHPKLTIEQIELLAFHQQNDYKNNNYIFDDEDGFTGWRWEKYNKQLKIVCAANRYKDLIIIGIRHHCPIMRNRINEIGRLNLLKYAGGANFKDNQFTKEEQGFVDQFGTFHDRETAFKIALEAGQIKEGETEHKSKLFSEDLY